MVDLNAYVARAPRAGDAVKSGAQIAAFVRRLDPNGRFDVVLVTGPDGQLVSAADRAVVLDAEELVELIRVAVRDEVCGLLARHDTDGRARGDD